MTRREAVKAYQKIAKKLGKLQVDASLYVSRTDNNQIFEIEHFLAEVAERIESKYPEMTYRRLLN